MSRHESDPIERLLREQALRPEDALFTQRVLAALPSPPRRMHWPWQSSFAVTTRVAVMLALAVAAERGYRYLGGGTDALIIILLALVPAFAAAQSLCGPLIPSSTLRMLWRVGRHWR